MSKLSPLPLPNLATLETREVWAALTVAHRHLAELKGLCESLPNQAILLDTLGIQEAKDSSEIENIITTHDQLFASQPEAALTPAAYEVACLAGALSAFAEAAEVTLPKMAGLRLAEWLGAGPAGGGMKGRWPPGSAGPSAATSASPTASPE